MSPGLHKLTTLFLGLVLCGLLSGCVFVGVVAGAHVVGELVGREVGRALEPAVVAVVTKPRDPYSHRTGKNHYEPVILTSNEDMVSIKYLNIGPNAEHEQVTQLIFDHCDGAYIETSRMVLRGYTTVNADCTHGAEVLQ